MQVFNPTQFRLSTHRVIAACLFFSFILFPSAISFAQSNGTSVELNGDTIEYAMDGDKIIAKGHVVITFKDTVLTCDEVEFFRIEKVAHARGHVHLKSKQGELYGRKMTFNFGTMSGDFNGAKIVSLPLYGASEDIHRTSDGQMVLSNGYMTTCDFDKPQYRIHSKKIEIHPGKKMIARNVTMRIGDLPVFWLPRITQNLKDGKPQFLFTPGFDKEWGMFVLTRWRYILNDNLRGTFHLDAREKKDVAWGIDAQYEHEDYGKGLIRTYYMNERSITSTRFWNERPTPTIEKERYKIEWRHNWKFNPKTRAILQYYLLSDSTFLKDYFEREYDKDNTPDSFFLLTHSLPKGVVSFRTDVRVNRFYSQLERLPEVRYDLSSQEVGDTGLYFKNTTSFVNLTNKTASPSEVRQETMRLDTDSQLSYPKKVGIFEFKPYVGGEHTYYSKTKNPDKYHAVRGIFRTGASLSSKFYRIFEYSSDAFGMDIDRLRHIITPSVDYSYISEPTLSSGYIDNFDGIDSRDNAHSISFSLENKLQTKRKGRTIEFFRGIISVPFALKENPGGGGFGSVKSKMDFRPKDWFTLYFDSTYDTKNDRLSSANFDIYINGPDKKWRFNLGKRYSPLVDDQVTTGFTWRINPKWAVKLYNRFDVMHGIHKEQDYVLTRDLHSWDMDINFNSTRGEGDEILMIFRLKAFPDIGFDFGTGFNKRKAGSQSE